MNIKMLGAIGGAMFVAGYGMYFLTNGFGAVMGTENYISHSQAVMCVEGLNGILPSDQAEQCASLFTTPSRWIKRTADGYAIMAGMQMSRYDISQIHHAVVIGAPERMAKAESFDTWWEKQPVKGS
ncbi:MULTISPECIES: hypothetical protein [unclassified Aeromonas]|uniref:hypothetical protein n=1 Tax=Aeromonas TaxID=642 RepID=UPI0035278CED